MNTPTLTRRSAAAAGLLTSVLVAACGGDPGMSSSNRGAGTHTEDTSVENAFIVPRFVPGSCAIQIGDTAALKFTVTNNRSAEPERLLGIHSPAAEAIRLAPDATLQIPPKTSIAAGQPVEDVGDGVPDHPFTASIEGLRESAKPATSVDMTFRFEQQGDLTMKVPVEACPTQK